jgi:hypothetical protein
MCGASSSNHEHMENTLVPWMNEPQQFSHTHTHTLLIGFVLNLPRLPSIAHFQCISTSLPFQHLQQKTLPAVSTHPQGLPPSNHTLNFSARTSNHRPRVWASKVTMSNIDDPPPPPYIEEPLPVYTPTDPSPTSRSSSISSDSSDFNFILRGYTSQSPSYASVAPSLPRQHTNSSRTPDVALPPQALSIPTLTPSELTFTRTLTASRAAPVPPVLLMSGPAPSVLLTNTITWPLTMPRRVPVPARRSHVTIDMPAESASQSDISTMTMMTSTTTRHRRRGGGTCAVLFSAVFVVGMVVMMAFLIKGAEEEADERQEAARTQTCSWLSRCQ